MPQTFANPTLGRVVRDIIRLCPRGETGTLQQNVLLVRDWAVRRLRIGLNRSDWSWLQKTGTPPITTSVGNATYTLPVDFRTYLDFYNVTNSSWITLKPPDWIDRADPGLLQQSAPRVFTIWGGNQVTFYPIPDAAYQVNFRYNANAPDPVVATDTMPLPGVEWVVRGAVADGYRYLNSVRPNPAYATEIKRFDDEAEALFQTDLKQDRQNVILPSNVADQDGGSTWYSADDFRRFDVFLPR